LFDLPAPAGIINEKKSYCVDDDAGQYVVPKSVKEDGTWKWHRVYQAYPFGSLIPKEITDRVKTDPDNMGMNASLYLFEPSMRLFESILEDLHDETMRNLIGRFPWPEMQYMTLKMSGKWHNMDLRFSSFNGYPMIDVLYGIHFAGLKPWQKNHRSIKHFARFEDYRLWYAVFMRMMQDYPQLESNQKLKRLVRFIQRLHEDEIYRFTRTDIASVRALFE